LDRVADVVLVILERDVDGFADVDVGGEVHDDFDFVFLEDGFYGSAVAQIFIEKRNVVCNGGAVTVNEVVEDKRGVASGLELSDAVTTDVACASYDEYVHEFHGDRVSELSQELSNSAFHVKQTL